MPGNEYVALIELSATLIKVIVPAPPLMTKAVFPSGEKCVLDPQPESPTGIFVITSPTEQFELCVHEGNTVIAKSALALPDLFLALIE